jgi:hypothetical protein
VAWMCFIVDMIGFLNQCASFIIYKFTAILLIFLLLQARDKL